MKIRNLKLVSLCLMLVFVSLFSVSFVRAMEQKSNSYPKKGEIQIQKIDEDTSLPIEGATLKLVEHDNDNVVEEWKTDKNVKTITVDLHKKYRLVEVQPADGYEKSEDIEIMPDKNITIEDGNIQMNPDNQVYMGIRNNSMRRVTDGTNTYVVYCINEKLKNPDDLQNLGNINVNDPKFPHYTHHSLRSISDEELNENQNNQVDRNGLANLLLAGYPNDMYGYKT